MNTVTFSIILFMVAAVHGNPEMSNDILDYSEESSLEDTINKIYRKIQIFEDEDIKDLKRNVLASELEFFSHKIRYDEPLLTLRINLLKNMENGELENAAQCHKEFHKKLNLLVRNRAMEFEHKARRTLDDIVEKFKSISKDLKQIKQDNANQIVVSDEDKVMRISQDVDKKIKTVLRLPQTIRNGWSTFEKSEEIADLIKSTEDCYHDKNLMKSSFQRSGPNSEF